MIKILTCYAYTFYAHFLHTFSAYRKMQLNIDQLNENVMIIESYNESRARESHAMRRSEEVQQFANKFFVEKQRKLNEDMERTENINNFTRNYYLAKDDKHQYSEEVNAQKELQTWRNFVKSRLE